MAIDAKIGERTYRFANTHLEAFHPIVRNAQAQELMTDHFSIQMQNLVIKQNFSKELTKIMPARKAMRVMQIENKLDAAIDLQLASEIPLAK